MTSPSTKRQYFSAVGKRKTAIARVKVYPGGSGVCSVNGESVEEYFDGVAAENVCSPLARTETKAMVDIEARVAGGGKPAQADAVRHGVSRALILLNPEFRPELKRAGFLRRDPRIKKKKKPGLRR
ncbi:30S ribosomal protein S9, partial [Candidatus Peregrinibacteria bacterium]|nr:30S ribosomal protein S9 [Candidatus Peregrinibacteria bacterium]